MLLLYMIVNSFYLLWFNWLWSCWKIRNNYCDYI